MENEEKLVEKMILLSGNKEDYIRKDQLVKVLNDQASLQADLNYQDNRGQQGTARDIVSQVLRRLANDIQALEG